MSEFDSNGNLTTVISNSTLDYPTFIAIRPLSEPGTWTLLLAEASVFFGWHHNAKVTKYAHRSKMRFGFISAFTLLRRDKPRNLRLKNEFRTSIKR